MINQKCKIIHVSFIISCMLDYICLESCIKLLSNLSFFKVKIYTYDDNVTVLTAAVYDILNKNKYEHEEFSLSKMKDSSHNVCFIANPSFTDALYDGITSLGVRIAYIPYGLSISGEDYSNTLQYRQKIHLCAWRIYASAEFYVKKYVTGDSLQDLRIVNIRTSPKFDHARKITHNKPKKFTFLWNIHMRIFPTTNYPFCFSAFTAYFNDIHDFAKSNEDTINVCIRPHPSLLNSEDSFFFKKYLSIFNDCNNVFLENGDSATYDLAFAYSNVFITDLSSMMWDYLVTGKPIISLHYPLSARLNEFARNAFENYTYQAFTPGKLREYMTTLASGVDPLKDKRLTMLDSGDIFDVSTPASAIIAKDVAKAFGVH